MVNADHTGFMSCPTFFLGLFLLTKTDCIDSEASLVIDVVVKTTNLSLKFSEGVLPNVVVDFLGDFI
jgi:hypothetical protein